MMNLKTNINIIRRTVLVLSVLGFVGCGSSSNDGSKPIVETVENMSGVYRTDGDLSKISSITSIEIFNGSSETELTADILRNGLSFDERVYFNNLNEVQFADDRFGRTLNLTSSKEGKTVRNELVADKSFVDVCGEKVSLDSRSMDFQYCLSLTREVGSLIATGNLVLNVYEFGEKVHEIKTPFRLFTKDRWFVDYFGEWTGTLNYRNGNAYGLRMETGQRLDVTFQPVSETDYILRPLDTNQTIMLSTEVFVLQPNTRPMSELEESANPYINFIYISTRDGNRQVHFNSFVHSDGYIEGNIELRVNGRSPVILGTYSLDQVQ